jgi:hypothetical protein
MYPFHFSAPARERCCALATLWLQLADAEGTAAALDDGLVDTCMDGT